MEKVAVIDIGSNSIRLVVFEVSSKGFNVIDEMKATVRLGDGLGADGRLQAASMDKAIEALKRFAVVSHVYGASVSAVATAASRKAVNGLEFMERIKSETGIEVRLIKGEEEAELDYLGAIHSLDINDGLMMDIGGGSTELVLIRERQAVQRISLPFGSLDLARRFELVQTVSPEKAEELVKFLKQSFAEIPWLKGCGKGPLIGIGGVIRNIGKIDRKKKQYPLDLAHGYVMNYDDVRQMYDFVEGKNLAERKLIEGLASERADIFVGANAAVKILMEYTKTEELLISGYGIREGVIYQRILEKYKLNDVLDDSLENLMDLYQVNYRHAFHVYHLYSQLFAQLQKLHGIEENFTKINKAAALLHDIGLAIRFYDHHEHTYYLILNAGLVGLSHRELVLSAHIAASHRLKKFKLATDEYKMILKKEEKLLIRKAGILLQLANSLDRSLIGKISAVNCDIKEDKVIIKTVSDESCLLEISEAMQAAAVFEKIFNKSLQIV